MESAFKKKDNPSNFKSKVHYFWKNTKKVLLLVFVLFHLTSILSQGFWSTFDVYWSVHYNEDFSIPFLDWTKGKKNIQPYFIFSGINTGYGFYGIKTATEKYFKVIYFDSTGNVISQDRYHGFNTLNGISRYKGYASSLGNYISDTDKLREKYAFNNEYKEVLEFRQNYAEKSFKWVGQRKAKTIEGCSYYKVELITIVPDDIWDKNNHKKKPKIYAIQDYTFSLE